MQSPITPPTSDSSDDNNEVVDKDSDETLEDNDETFKGDNENMAWPDKNSMLYQADQSLAASAPGPENKKIKLHTDKVQELVPNDDIQVQVVDDKGKSECLVCSKCLCTTFYEALATEPDFFCDECLAGAHLECEVEDCSECKQIGEMIVSRRQAEVYGRVEKLTGHNVSQM